MMEFLIKASVRLAGVAFLIWASQAADFVLPTFPGCEGWGMASTGGRGGNVRLVTRTDDPAGNSTVGTFRWACLTDGDNPKMVLIKTNGLITLTRTLTLGNNTTIVGHTAPGLGVCIRGWPVQALDATNIVVYGMRFRQGDIAGIAPGQADPLNFGGIFNYTTMQYQATNIVVAKSSFSWGVDETMGMDGVWYGTFQDCIIGEPLPSDGIAYDNLSSRAKALGAFSGFRVSTLRNLWVHCSHRTPLADGPGGKSDVRNNVTYNAYLPFPVGRPQLSGLQINVVNNWVNKGPLTNVYYPANKQFFIENADPANVGLYLSGNHIVGFPDVTTDNFKGVFWGDTNSMVMTPWVTAYATNMTALQALQYATNNAGSRVGGLDSVDVRLIGQLHGDALDPDTYTGLIYSQDNVGGWPNYSSSDVPYTDTDQDGMEDSWELANFNSSLERDGKGYWKAAIGFGYTDLECYLWGLDPDIPTSRRQDYYTGEFEDEVSEPEIPPDPDPPVTGTKASINGKASIGKASIGQ